MNRTTSRRRAKPTGQHTYTIVITPRATGGYLATCPALPAVRAEASSPARAHDRVAAEVAEQIENLLSGGQPLPADDVRIATVTVDVNIENPPSDEDAKDAQDARRARTEAQHKGAISWEQLKSELNL